MKFVIVSVTVAMKNCFLCREFWI